MGNHTASGGTGAYAARARARSTGAGGASARRGSGGGNSTKAPRAAKTPEEQQQAKLAAAQAKVNEAERQVNRWQEADQQGITYNHMTELSEARIALGKAQESLARLEGRQLGPGEKQYTREEYLSGKALYTKGNQLRTISPEEARAYLATPTPRGTKAPAAPKTAAGGAKASGKASGKASAGGAKATGQGAAKQDLAPLGYTLDMSRYDPYATPDPFFQRALYGDRQLSAAMSRYPMPTLRAIGASIGVKVPGTRAGAVKAIVDHVQATESQDETVRRYLAPGASMQSSAPGEFPLTPLGNLPL